MWKLYRWLAQHAWFRVKCFVLWPLVYFFGMANTPLVTCCPVLFYVKTTYFYYLFTWFLLFLFCFFITFIESFLSRFRGSSVRFRLGSWWFWLGSRWFRQNLNVCYLNIIRPGVDLILVPRGTVRFCFSRISTFPSRISLFPTSH